MKDVSYFYLKLNKLLASPIRSSPGARTEDSLDLELRPPRPGTSGSARDAGQSSTVFPGGLALGSPPAGHIPWTGGSALLQSCFAP